MGDFPKMVDMRRTPAKVSTSAMPMSEISQYPWGLTLTLTHDELEKLGVDISNFEVGDMFHLAAMTKVTSVSENETEAGKCSRVELQIVALGAESEDAENEQISRKKAATIRYKKR